jgi:hypothetical protein
MEMESILHENQSLVQEIRSEATAKNVFKGNENGQLHKRQQPEINGGEANKEGYGERHGFGVRFL